MNKSLTTALEELKVLKVPENVRTHLKDVTIKAAVSAGLVTPEEAKGYE